jgi:hypothetical protein
MRSGTETITWTWNGCPPETVSCPGRPFVCLSLSGNKSVAELCSSDSGAFACPTGKTFCGYQRNSKGELVDGVLKPICLPSDASSIACFRADRKPLAKNFTFGKPFDQRTEETILGQLPDGTAGPLVAKFGCNRSKLQPNVPAFFTGDGSETNTAVSFSVQCFSIFSLHFLARLINLSSGCPNRRLGSTVWPIFH